MLLKERLFFRNMFLTVILAIIVIIIHFREHIPKEGSEITTRNNKLHQYLDLDFNNCKEILEDDWILSVNHKIDPYESINIYELLYSVNIASLTIDSFQKAIILDSLNITQVPALFYIRNGVVLDSGSKIVSILDFKKKTDLMNVIDLYCLAKVNRLHKYLKSLLTRVVK